jgi:hypothetical protein
MATTSIFKCWFFPATFLFLLGGSSAFTQEKAKDPPKEEIKGPKSTSLVRVGYTRPGTPADRIGKNGEIIQAALDQDLSGSVIGSTVYFAVYKGQDADAFGNELADLTDVFVPGRSFENSVSPQFDRKAKYLYLYQIVNDRGLNPPKEGIVPAADFNINTAHIADFALRLLVDPRYITSWGHFQNMSFAGNVTDKKVGKGGVAAAADEDVILPMAFSSNPAVIGKLPHKRFQDRAPAYGLVVNSFGVDKSNLNLQNSSAFQALKKKEGAKAINWVSNEVKAAALGGLEPDYVQLVYNSFRENEEGALDGRHIGNTLFRVDFKKNNMVQIGQHSVVFGFTSDLPPTDEPIRVEGPMPTVVREEEKKAKEGKDIKEAGLSPAVQGIAEAPAVAIGTAPTPIGGGWPIAAAMPTGMIGGGLPLGSGVGGIGGIGGFALPGAGFGAARAPATATGGGQGTSQGQGTQAQNQQQQTPNTINFNATLTNQQQQQQAQLQAQLQFQNQRQFQINRHRHHHGHVVPEPSSIILGLLGVPALYLLRRRSKTDVAGVL